MNILSIFVGILAQPQTADASSIHELGERLPAARSAIVDVSVDELTAASKSHEWLKLLHYVKPVIGKPRSDIISPEFFLSPSGQSDPRAELVATLHEMAQPIGSDPNAHARCRYPARLLWLQRNHLIDQSAPVVPCPAYRDWQGDHPPTGASLIFATGYLDNPSSFYGHMLLRLDTNGGATRARDAMLDTALNYGANYPASDLPPVFIVKGIFGGYPSTFSNLTFYDHQNLYNQEQLRDVWVYDLKLDKDQVALLTAHSWELLRASNRYYFLKQNCAYRIAELLGVVLDHSVLPKKPWVMPVDVLVEAAKADNRGSPLVESIARLPSRRTEFREKYANLPVAGREAVDRLASEPVADPAMLVRKLGPAQQSAVLETMIDYTDMKRDETGPHGSQSQETKTDLELARMRLPSGAEAELQPAPSPPHQGQGSSLAQISYLTNSSLGSGAELRLRATYNDLLSTTPGALPYSELSILDVRIDALDHRIRLRSLEAVRVTALNLSDTGLAADGGNAWRLRVGVEQDTLTCRSCTVGYLEGGYGKATRLGSNLVAYGFANGRVVGPDSFDGALHVGAAAGLIAKPSDWWGANFELGVWQDLGGDGKPRPYGMIEMRYNPSPNWSLNLSARHEDDGRREASELRVGFSKYW